MNNRIIYCLFIILFTSMTACTDGGLVNQNSSEQTKNKLSAELADDKLAQYLVDLGFQADMIETFDEGYLVEEDIYFTRDRLSREMSKNAPNGTKDPELKQWVSDYVVNIGNVDDIIIKVESGVPNSWETAVNQSASEWNNINDSNVNISVNNSSSNPDITVSMDPSLNGSNVVAYADFPAYGEPGSIIRINSDFNWLGSDQKKHNMAHEIGHDLGFRHTNWDDRNETQPGGRLNFTPSTDANSIMNGGTGTYSWNGFSTYDIYGTQVMYPESLAGSINDTRTESERSSTRGGRDTFYFVVEYSVTGGKFQRSKLQKKVNNSWEYISYDVSHSNDDEFWVKDEREDTMEGSELRIIYENYKGDVVAYSPSYIVSF